MSFVALFFIATLHAVSFDLSCEIGFGTSERLTTKKGSETTHRIYKRVVAVEDAINGFVHCVVDVLEQVLPIWRVPWLL